MKLYNITCTHCGKVWTGNSKKIFCCDVDAVNTTIDNNVQPVDNELDTLLKWYYNELPQQALELAYVSEYKKSHMYDVCPCCSSGKKIKFCECWNV